MNYIRNCLSHFLIINFKIIILIHSTNKAESEGIIMKDVPVRNKELSLLWMVNFRYT